MILQSLLKSPQSPFTLPQSPFLVDTALCSFPLQTQNQCASGNPALLWIEERWKDNKKAMFRNGVTSLLTLVQFN